MVLCTPADVDIPLNIRLLSSCVYELLGAERVGGGVTVRCRSCQARDHCSRQGFTILSVKYNERDVGTCFGRVISQDTIFNLCIKSDLATCDIHTNCSNNSLVSSVSCEASGPDWNS